MQLISSQNIIQGTHANTLMSGQTSAHQSSASSSSSGTADSYEMVHHHAQSPPRLSPNHTNELKRDDYERSTLPTESVAHCEAFEPHKPKQPGLRANVYVSKECTRDLAEHIVEESWGPEYGMLYKYLDYIFRCQVFERHVRRITFNHHHPQQQQQQQPQQQRARATEIVVFHSGLQRRSDHEFLYFVLKANDTDKRNAEQKWRVPAGHIRESCVSREELLREWRLSDQQVPPRTRFYSSLQELLFDEECEIEVNWPERLRTNKERIYQELKHNNGGHGTPHALMSERDIDKTNLVKELTEVFEVALVKAQKRARANPRLAVAQGFVETKQYKKRVELLLPLRVEYPKNSGRRHLFALALRKADNQRKYMGMSLLTMSMAYANARLVGYVDSAWLTAEVAVNSAPNRKEKKEKDGKKEHEPMSMSMPMSPQTMQAMHMNMHMNAMYARGARPYAPMAAYTSHAQALRMRVSGGGGNGSSMAGGSMTPYRQVQSMPPMPESRMVAIDEVHMTPEEVSYALAHPYVDMHMMVPQQHPQPPPNYTYRNNDDRSVSDVSDPAITPTAAAAAGHGSRQTQYSRSAAPIINPPELHHKLDDDDDAADDHDQDDDISGKAAAVAADDFAFPLDTEMEHEIQSPRLCYHVQSAPPKTTTTHSAAAAVPDTQLPRKTAPMVSPQMDAAHSHSRARSQVVAPPPYPAYRKHGVAKLPERVLKFAQPTTQQFGVVPYAQTNYQKPAVDAHSIASSLSDSDPTTQKFLIEISRLPGDCGVNMLRHILTANGFELQSVHLVEEDKTAVLRLADPATMNRACQFMSRFQWRCKVVVHSPYLRYYDQQKVWQYQVSNKWAPHHADMARLIERIPARTDLIVEHGANRRYFIEKYNKQQGRQTNVRTKNQRMIRRIRIHVWAPKENPIFAKAIPVIATDEQFDSFFYNTPRQRNNVSTRSNGTATTNAGSGSGGGGGARFHLHRSEPAQNQIASEREKRLSAAQKVVPSQTRVDSKLCVIRDNTQYSHWRALDDDDEEYEVLMEQCGMRASEFSAVWNYLVPPHEALSQFALSSEYEAETPLFFVADAFEEQDVKIMEKSFRAFNSGAAMDVEQFTFFKHVSAAMDAFSGDADGNNNIKIFMCSVYLTQQQRTEFEDNEEVNVEDMSTIKLLACACVNVFVLKEALAIE